MTTLPAALDDELFRGKTLAEIEENKKRLNRHRARKQYKVSLGKHHAVLRVALDAMIDDALNSIMRDGTGVARSTFFQRMARGYEAQPARSLALWQAILSLPPGTPPTDEPEAGGDPQWKASLGGDYAELRPLLNQLFGDIQKKLGVKRADAVQHLAWVCLHSPDDVAVLAKELII